MRHFLSACVCAAILAMCKGDGDMGLPPPTNVNDPNSFQPVFKPQVTQNGIAVTGAPQAQVYSPVGYSLENTYPGYQGYDHGYDHGYGQQSGFEGYIPAASAMDGQLTAPGYIPGGSGIDGQLSATSAYWPLGFLGGVVSSSIVGFIGKAILVVAAGFGVLLVGGLGILGVCAFTPLCTVSFHGVTPHLIKEEVRSLITPDNISRASKFVREAVSKYQKMQSTHKKR